MKTKNKYEQKFIVINYKRFDEMNTFIEGKECVNRFIKAGTQFEEDYERITGKKLDQNYIVINEDEPYIQKIYKIMNLDRSIK